jgi:hypothetical protein
LSMSSLHARAVPRAPALGFQGFRPFRSVRLIQAASVRQAPWSPASIAPKARAVTTATPTIAASRPPDLGHFAEPASASALKFSSRRTQVRQRISRSTISGGLNGASFAWPTPGAAPCPPAPASPPDRRAAAPAASRRSPGRFLPLVPVPASGPRSRRFPGAGAAPCRSPPGSRSSASRPSDPLCCRLIEPAVGALSVLIASCPDRDQDMVNVVSPQEARSFVAGRDAKLAPGAVAIGCPRDVLDMPSHGRSAWKLRCLIHQAASISRSRCVKQLDRASHGV